jgi:lipopolysaccharide export LptBFGC system permease protein LptF
MAFNNEFVREKLFLIGVAFIFMGVLVFLGATPRRMAANPVGGAWVGAAILIGIGLILLAIDYYLNR